MIVDKIFICHHTPLQHRKKRLLSSSLFPTNIPVEWVENYRPEEIRNRYDEIIGEVDLSRGRCPGEAVPEWEIPGAGKKVTVPELSLYLKHKYCLEEQVDKKYSQILVLEDDSIIPDNFYDYLERCVNEFNAHEPKLDYLMLGTCCGFKSKGIVEGKMIYTDDRGPGYGFRCSGAQVVNLDTAKTILKHINHINWPYDWKLSEIGYMENIKVGCAEPPILQGSQHGDPSSIQGRT